MSFVDDLLVILSDYHEGYRLMRRRIRGDYRDFPKRFREVSDNTLRVTLSRLKAKGLVRRNERGIWSVTEKGLHRIKRRFSRRAAVSSPEKKRAMIIAFDIPESYRRERDWLRVELRFLGFEMLQRSVWFGPAELPEDFIAKLQDCKILKFMKFFEAKERDVV